LVQFSLQALALSLKVTDFDHKLVELQPLLAEHDVLAALIGRR
jgi:hypothetical protein